MSLKEQPILSDLAQLLDAGVAPIQACDKLLKIRPKDKEIIVQLARDLKHGRCFAKAINNAGLCSHLEYEIINIAETSGKLDAALRLVATKFDERQKRSRELSVRLLLPNFIVFIMLAITIVQALATGANLTPVIVKAIFVIILVFGITRLLLTLTRRDATYWLAVGWNLGLEKSSNLFRRYSEYIFYTLLYWQVEAGLNYIVGAKSLATLIDAKAYRTTVNHYLQLISDGNAVTDSLLNANLMTTGELVQIMRTAEQSGSMSQSLQHYLILEGQRLEQTTDTIFTWLPRIYYFIVALFAISFIL